MKTIVLRPTPPASGGQGPTPQQAPLQQQPPPTLVRRVELPAPPPQFHAAPRSSSPRGPASPLMGPMYWATSDLFILASELAQGASTRGSVEELRATIARLLAEMTAKAYGGRGSAGEIPAEDLREADYALCALFDEIMVHTRRGGWRLLQLERFQESTAGEGFFVRARALLQNPHKAHVLQVYFLCLSLGFRGRYSMGGQTDLDALYAEMARVLAAHTLPSETVSPHGEPRDRLRLLQAEAPLVRLAVAVFAVALLVFLVLRLTLSMRVSAVTEPMRSFATKAP